MEDDMVRLNRRWRPRLRGVLVTVAVGVTAAISAGCQSATSTPQAAAAADEMPAFRYDPTWPKPLPNGWLFGQAGGIAIDSKDHVWIYHRTGTATGLGDTWSLE